MTDQAFNVGAATSEQAQARIDGLASNPEWSAKLAARDPATFREFHILSHRAAGLDLPPPDGLVLDVNGQLDLMNARRNLPAIEVTSSEHGSPTMTTSEQLEMFESFRRLGFDDARILERHDPNRSYSAEEIATAQRELTLLMADPVWCAKLLAGDPLARIVLSDRAVKISGNVKRA
jgi:hypothetical protein